MNTNDKQIRIAEAEKIFNLLYGNVTERKFGYLWAKKGDEKKTYPFTVSNPAERKAMAVKAIELNDDGADVYYGVNLVDSALAEYQRAKNETVTMQLATLTDIDVEGGNHISNDKIKYPPTFDVAKSFLPFHVSILVDSGYGMHGIDLYDKPININDENRAQAKERNKKFISVIRDRAGIYSKAVDGIGDLARVLRVPGTRNYKLGISGDAPLCHIVEDTGLRFSPADLDQRLDAFIANTAKPAKAKAEPKAQAELIYQSPDSTEYDSWRVSQMVAKIPVADLSDTDWLSAITALKSLGYSYAEVDCLNQGGKHYDEKENRERWDSTETWSRDTAIGTLVNLGKQFGYDPQAAYREFCKLKPKSASEKLAHPDTCAGNAVRTRDRIRDCPADLILPDNFIFGHNGITLIIPPRKEGVNPKYVCVARTPIIPIKIFREPKQSKYTYEIATLIRGVWRTTEIDGRTLCDPRAITILADTGALILEPKWLCTFLTEVISLNPDLQEVKAFASTGWTDDSFTTFAYPGKNDCVIRRPGFDFNRTLAERGNAEEWKKKFIEVAEKGGAIARAYIGTALAAIIARPLNIMNPQCHLHGTSGGGKTALQKFAASIFGNPRELMKNFAASAKNRQLVAAAFCDLPCFYDELETIQGRKAEEQISSDVYNYADGLINQANKRDGTARETFRFGGARLTTGERPILKQNDLRGAYKRLIQFTLHDKIFDDEFASDLHIFSESNFGHYAAQWSNFAQEHMEQIKAKYVHFAKSNPTTKQYEPTHLKLVTASLIAFDFFKICIGINEEFKPEDFIRDRRIIIDSQLPSLSEISDTERALEDLKSYTAGHEKYFLRNQKDTNGEEMTFTFANETYGKIFDNGEVAFFPTALKRILEDELHFASADKIIAEWRDKGYLVTNDGRRDHVIKIGKKTYKCIHFRAGLVTTDTDAAEYKVYEDLGVVS